MQLAEYTRVTSPEFQGNPLDPESWLARRGEVLRELPGRRVYRSEIGGQRVVVKEFTPRRLRQWLRAYAQTEADNAEAVHARGVAVVEPLAWARLADGRQVVVLKEEQGARSLHDLVVSGELTGQRRHDVARRVGELLAAMQNAGIRHTDPHAGNVLVRLDDSVLLADPGSLKPGDYLTAGERARTLATFSLFFWTHGNVIDRLLFWGAYGRASGFSPEDLEDLRRRVVERIPRAFRRLAGLRARRTRRLGRPVKIATLSGILLRDLPAKLVEEIADKATRLREGPHVLKKSPTAWTFTAGDEYVVKVFLPKKATRPIRDLLSGTRAERALDAAEAFFHRGLKTPELVGVFRDSAQAGRSVLVMRWEKEANGLEQALLGLEPRDAWALGRRLGRTLRRMHDWGLRHRDLKKDNILVSADGVEFRFLDLDGVRQTRGPLDWERRAKDLGNLAGSLLDRSRVPTGLRLRALDAYLDGDVPPGFLAGEFPRRVTEHARVFRARRTAR